MQLLDTYRALADESRLRLLYILSRGQFNVQELTSILQLSQPTVSHHLKVLQRIELVAVQREGTWAYYTLASLEEPAASALVAGNFLELAKQKKEKELAALLKGDETRLARVLDSRREDARNYFDSVAKDWNAIRSYAGTDDPCLEQLTAQIPADASLLELGCGSGALLKKILPRRGKTIGVDYSQAMLEQARTNLGGAAAAADLRLGYLEHLPLADECVEIAVCSMVMHHIAHPLEALRDAYRVLKKNGRLLILDLTSHKNEEMRERFADLWLGFNPAQFKRWVKEAGFRNIGSKLLGDNGEAFLLHATR